ncbi:MAG: zf-HC2 domain-containing protein [Motiliproteus sp.]|nr:zf-HC2 domain-containing protein [Motiliproteus sp.]MCW9051149.1 zf-HC2 domain-containing protein [Motiliproteus sp.]
MLKCKHITEQASSYIDGEMGFMQRLKFRMHLALCKHCKRFVDNFKAGIEMVKRLPRNQVDKDKIDATLRRVRDSK